MGFSSRLLRAEVNDPHHPYLSGTDGLQANLHHLPTHLRPLLRWNRSLSEFGLLATHPHADPSGMPV